MVQSDVGCCYLLNQTPRLSRTSEGQNRRVSMHSPPDDGTSTFGNLLGRGSVSASDINSASAFLASFHKPDVPSFQLATTVMRYGHRCSYECGGQAVAGRVLK